MLIFILAYCSFLFSLCNENDKEEDDEGDEQIIGDVDVRCVAQHGWCPAHSTFLHFRKSFVSKLVSTSLDRLSPGFVLKSVELHVTPADTVERGTELKLTCIANVGHSGTSPVLHFSFFKDYNKHNSVHISQTNTSNQVTYSISKARASHSGKYQCDVKVNGQYMESSNKMISVKGKIIFSVNTP